MGTFRISVPIHFRHAFAGMLRVVLRSPEARRPRTTSRLEQWAIGNVKEILWERSKSRTGQLRELYLTESNAENEKLAAADYSSWNLTDRQLCDLELLLNGAFSPLDGFLSLSSTSSVLATMRLPSGLVWPIPINLDVSREFAASIKSGDRIGLRDPEGVLIATMEVGDIWEPDKARRHAASLAPRTSTIPASIS